MSDVESVITGTTDQGLQDFENTTSTDMLLSEVMKNRIARKGRTVLTNGLLTALSWAVYAFLQGSFDEDGAVLAPATAFIIIMAPPIVIGMIYFLHSVCFVRKLTENSQPSKEVEEKYARTNFIPFIDSILEVPMSFQNGNKCVVICNTLYFLVFGGSIGLEAIQAYLDPEKLKADGRVLGMACTTAVLAMYQFTGDMNEYCVHVSTAQTKPKKTKTVPV